MSEKKKEEVENDKFNLRLENERSYHLVRDFLKGEHACVWIMWNGGILPLYPWNNADDIWGWAGKKKCTKKKSKIKGVICESVKRLGCIPWVDSIRPYFVHKIPTPLYDRSLNAMQFLSLNVFFQTFFTSKVAAIFFRQTQLIEFIRRLKKHKNFTFRRQVDLNWWSFRRANVKVRRIKIYGQIRMRGSTQIVFTWFLVCLFVPTCQINDYILPAEIDISFE